MINGMAYVIVAILVYGAALGVIGALGIFAWFELERGYAKGQTDGLQHAGWLLAGMTIILLTLFLAWGWIRPDPGIHDNSFLSGTTTTVSPK